MDMSKKVALPLSKSGWKMSPGRDCEITISSLLQQDIRVVLPKCIEKDVPEGVMTLDTVRAVGTS